MADRRFPLLARTKGIGSPEQIPRKRRISNMREYEVTVVLKPDLDDESRTEVLGRIEAWISQGEGEDAKPSVDHWGQRKLAYPINNYTEGYYILYLAQMDPSSVSDVERNIQYVDEVLRHLVVRRDE
jgi:small subunit ribosomal protein S6